MAIFVKQRKILDDSQIQFLDHKIEFHPMLAGEQNNAWGIYLTQEEGINQSAFLISQESIEEVIIGLQEAKDLLEKNTGNALSDADYIKRNQADAIARLKAENKLFREMLKAANQHLSQSGIDLTTCF